MSREYSKLLGLLIEEEGMRTKPYNDTRGKLTIGVGRNLEDKGITKLEAVVLARNDIMEAVHQAESNFAWFEKLDEVRQDVVLAMIFQLGFDGFRGFKSVIGALMSRDYNIASAHMLLSKWATQTPARAQRMAAMMRTGQYPRSQPAVN